ncbi:hypothetical protein PWG14_25690 [Chromobacterium amazonense]|uniref:hypothetical protein n=1 Tax=Chromobacterium amazonense TaxID=1382803 RepID=UPI00237DE41A|nr:hypothetical protein [Chromobacterium amazonense]MDE1715859.1 hypothetical protein [Chromobacterium amazonense]
MNFGYVVNVRIILCVMAVIFSQKVFGNVYAHLNVVDRASTSSVESGSVAYDYCRIFMCPTKKTFIARSGSIDSLPRLSGETYTISSKRDLHRLSIYPKRGGSYQWGDPIVGNDIVYAIKIISVGFFIEGNGKRVSSMDLRRVINSSCALITEIDNATKSGVAVWVNGGVDCSITIDSFNDDLKLSDLVIQYRESHSGLTLLGQDSLAREELSKMITFSKGSVSLTVLPAINVRIKSNPYVRLISNESNQNVAMSKLGDDALAADATIHLATNTAFSVEIIQCGDAGWICRMHHERRVHSVPLVISMKSKNLQRCSSWVSLTLGIPVTCHPEYLFSDYNHAVNFRFSVDSLHAKAMIAGVYRTNVKITFSVKL